MSRPLRFSETATFGGLLRQLRRRAGLTQAELAARVNLSTAQISRLEQGERLPDVEAVAGPFAAALNLLGEPQLVQRLVGLAAVARGENPPTAVPSPSEGPGLVNRLPVPPTPLIGRAREVDVIARRLLEADGRLLTLVGPSGIGKTRLALAVVRQLQDLFADGVVFVPLVALADPDLVAPTIASALGIADVESGRKSPLRLLIEFLRRKEMLLALDNFEQLIAAAPLAATLLSECPHLRLLVTSTEPLRLRAEQRFPVAPLAAESAIELFVLRAQAVQPEFSLLPTEAAAVDEICTRLDRLPLAIELVASQIDVFSLAALHTHLNDHRLDSVGARDLPSHQQTLRDAIRRSYVLLTGDEAALFRLLGVFVGGCDPRAVEALWQTLAVTPDGRLIPADEDPAHSPRFLPLLTALVRKSLVRRSLETGEVRVDLLETIRAFALEQLAAQGELDALRRSHARYFFFLALEAFRLAHGDVKQAWMDRQEREHDNLRAALRWHLETDPEAAQRMAHALGRFWGTRGHFGEGRGWLVQVLDAGPAPTLARVRALNTASSFATQQGDYAEGLRLSEESLAILRQLGDARGLIGALDAYGWLAHDLCLPERAIACFSESLALLRQLDERREIAITLCSLVHVSCLQEVDRLQADAFLEESRAIARELHDPYLWASYLHAHGKLELRLGHDRAAVDLLSDAYARLRSLDERRDAAFVALFLGEALWRLEESDAACDRWEEALRAFETLDVRGGLAAVFYHLGREERRRSELESAAHLLQHSLTLCQETQERPAVPRALVALADVALADLQPEAAATLLAAAHALLGALPPFLAPGDRAELDVLLVDVRSALAPAAFAAAWETGCSMTREQAIEFALQQTLAHERRG